MFEWCVDVCQIFLIKSMVEYLWKDERLSAAFMGLGKTYNRIDREALWNVLKIYGVEGQLLAGVKGIS